MPHSFDNSRRNFLGLLSAAGTLPLTLGLNSADAAEPAKELPLVDSPPVLQCPTENSIAVVWAVGKPAAGFVEFGTAEDKLNRKAVGDVRGLNAYHRRYLTVRLEGLKPNTRYYYRTATAPFIFHTGHKLERQPEEYSKVYSFETPGEKKDTATFSVINDTHNNQKTLKELLMTELHLEDSDELCGLFQGVAMGEERHPMLLNSVTLFRQGILAQVLESADTITLRDLRRQIRITILHEYAHLHGLDEDEIDMLGYG